MINIFEMEDKEVYIELIDKLETNARSQLIGVCNILIYSKSIFPKNKNVCEFVEKIFLEKYPLYVLKSRTLISAKISKKICCMEHMQVVSTCKSIKSYFTNEDNTQDTESINDNSINSRKTKKKNENDKLDTWLRGL